MAIPDPLADFKFVGGRLCLDFVNTVSGRRSNPAGGRRDYRDVVIREFLVNWDRLLRWAGLAGAVPPPLKGALERTARRSPGTAARVLARGRALREAAYRMFVATRRGWPPRPADLAVMNREVQAARRHERLIPGAGGPTVEWADPGNLERVLWPVARSAADLLMAPERERVGQCGGEDCGWLFLDATRNHGRRWCDMADCGNLAKVRRFRRRR